MTASNLSGDDCVSIKWISTDHANILGGVWEGQTAAVAACLLFLPVWNRKRNGGHRSLLMLMHYTSVHLCRFKLGRP